MVKWLFTGLGQVSDDLYCRLQREEDKDAMDIDEEDEVDSIMDKDEGEPESSEVGDGEHAGEVDGNDDNEEEGTTPKS
jgi:hypothetical protein